MSAPFTLHQGDCIEVMRGMADNSVDSIVCDPPYGLSKEPDMAEVLRHWLAGDDYQHKCGGFMGKTWDSFVPGPAVWREALRVLKPGGHLLAFFGSRTYDMGTLAIRLAGFEVRDQIMWVYGSGFPKSLDVSKAIDRAVGVPVEGAVFKRMLGEAVAASGKARKQIDTECGFTMRYDTALDSDPVGWGCTYPGVEQWEKIKAVLPIPDGWDRFVAGVERDVLARQKRRNSPSGIDLFAIPTATEAA